MVAEAEDKQKGDEKDNERDHLAQKLRNDDLTALFKIKIPEIAIDQRDHDRGIRRMAAAPT